MRLFFNQLYLIEILHQTTTCGKCEDCLRRCILSKFYIKPQRSGSCRTEHEVVSYRNSTSNHNLYRNRTQRVRLYLIEILHQTTTGYSMIARSSCCILSKFYIKPQLLKLSIELSTGCILSKFYIKPQQSCDPTSRWKSCILSKFYIKPQPSKV